MPARVALLRALGALALEAEPVRDHLAARIDALTAPHARRAPVRTPRYTFSPAFWVCVHGCS